VLLAELSRAVEACVTQGLGQLRVELACVPTDIMLMVFKKSHYGAPEQGM
jgi:hypothetical protein